MKALNKTTFKKYIQAYDFTRLFNELGWEYLNEDLPKKAGDKTFLLKAIAHKEGFRIFVCNPDEEGKIPDSNIRKKIHTEISRLYFEHLIIFIDRDKTTQVWQLVIREQGKPQRVKQVTWYRHQEPELLYQRLTGAFFTIDETDKLTIVDVTHRLKENFGANAEKVTKKFYDVFKKEHTRFLKFLKGIEDNIARDWYASLMLNRLMFCYFIQRKGFLNNDRNYLRNKLKEVQAEKGKDKFFKFYYDFLKTLFHEGLGSPNHSKELKKLIGNIPYLNGGLFDTHRLETEYPKIQIDDAAFEHIFNFFDEWNWHLDVRPDATGNEINPDVIGYIFEKYINDRAQMGAYYTKEDITQYISKNCVIPFLFDETQRNYNKAFSTDSWLWTMVKESNDRYIYDAVKHGVKTDYRWPADLWADLPEDVMAGLDPNQPDLVEKRRCWNRSAPSESALPTEIWREVIDRRKRYSELRQKIENGEVTHINDFITYNLNICQLAQDVIANTTDPKFIQHFYIAIAGRIRDPKNSSIEPRQGITILDPTCGSGAFLFAAMEILKPLYDECLQRMDEFVQEHPKKHPFFEQVMADVDNTSIHPNRDYFIYKSIILRNLYGVDIMNEAVEIAKLRLFLKLVATVEADYNKPNMGLEPLPDVDFNIRTGNTLIGFATEAELNRAFEGKLDFDNDTEKIKEKCDIVARTFARYKEIQLTYSDDFEHFKEAKEELNKRLKELNRELSQLLHKQSYSNIAYQKWLATHQAFHWFAEFYEIIHDKGGFDVIIGNPPYVEYSKVKSIYSVSELKSKECGNLFAFIIERGLILLKDGCYIGMIVPISFNSTERMIDIRKQLFNYENHISSFADRPSCLFSGVHQILSIFITKKSDTNKIHSGGFHHWNKNERVYLFYKLLFEDLSDNNIIINEFKINSHLSKSIAKKVLLDKKNISHYFIGKKYLITYSGGTGGYWLRSFDVKQHSNEYKIVYTDKKELLYSIIGILNSSLFYLVWRLVLDCRHLTKNDISNFCINLSAQTFINKLEYVSYNQLKALKATNEVREGKMTYEQYRPAKTKPFIDEIDKVLAEHYGFTNEELDFIINYDIKYRMGKGLEGEDEDNIQYQTQPYPELKAAE